METGYLETVATAISPDKLSDTLLKYAESGEEVPHEGAGPRPKKRRKFTRSADETVLEDRWQDAVKVATLTLNLEFATENNTFTDPEMGSDESLPVILEMMRSRGRKYDSSMNSDSCFAIRSPNSISPANFKFGPETHRRVIHSILSATKLSKEAAHAKINCVLKRVLWEDNTTSYQLWVDFLWHNSRDISEFSEDKATRVLLEALYPPWPAGSATWGPHDFYSSVHVPAGEGECAEAAARLSVEELNTTLFPFQKRTTAWLLQREGVDTTGKTFRPEPASLDHGFFKIRVRGFFDESFYINRWLCLVTTRKSIPEDLRNIYAHPRGGLLAEEMGLGKTVEIVALLLLHQRNLSKHEQQREADQTLRKSNATLIVSPVSIEQQWVTELEKHAPSLRVMVYQGIKNMSKKATDEEMVEALMDYDVVLCSYTILSGEIHFAGTQPDRSLRHEKQYEKRKSPLVQIDWWRCVLDECQMVESGVSQAAQVANTLPRQNSWAVSGTPVGKKPQDLLGLLTFLRVQPYCWSKLLFQRLVSETYKPILKDFLGVIALRHSKDQVKADLHLPRQRRVVMSMSFLHVEETHYTNLFEQMCEDCGLSLEGAPLNDEFDPESPQLIEKMRTWLARLRQTVLHPEVGDRNRRALGRTERPLRTAAAVLRVMTEQNNTSIRTAERTWLQSKLRRGQILEHAKRSQEALDIWLSVGDLSSKVVDECRGVLHRLESGIASRSVTPSVREDTPEDSDDETEGESKGRVGAARVRLRSALEVLHAATFFVGNAYYQIKTNEELTKPDSEQFKALDEKEANQYERAKGMRKEMLTESLAKANAIIAKLRGKKSVEIPEYGEIRGGGIESRELLDKADMLTQTLSAQAEKIDDWREALIELCLKPLIDQEDEELKGDEYETSTKQQDEQNAYMEALRAIVADRADYMSGEENMLIKRDVAVAMQRAKDKEGPAPELMLNMLEERRQLAPKVLQGFTIRSVINELRGMRTDLERYQSARHNKELTLVNLAMDTLSGKLQDQNKVNAELDKEVELFSNVINARTEFYRRLQEISDSVAPYEYELDENEVEDLLAHVKKEEEHNETKLNAFKSRGRYLEHLKTESTAEEGSKKCIICQEPIEIGVLLSCGHIFDKECLKQWYSSHRTCPVCKKKLSKHDFHQITFKPRELRAQEEPSQSSQQANGVDSDGPTTVNGDSKQTSTMLYSGINRHTLDQIKNIDLNRSFGTKIDTLARHIIWLQSSDPGAKSIIFSQWRDFLDILGRAFQRFKIGFTTIDEKQKGIERFKDDDSVECFFLHAKAHSSGLNLVNATHVFLCEPLINTALELQVIARVHRIGQLHQTNVYMYLVEDTVEQAIYDISVKRRMEHISKTVGDSPRKNKKVEIEEDEIEKANSLELVDAATQKLLASGRGAGEMVDKGDLWNCLFGAKTKSKGQKSSEEVERTVAGFLGAEAADKRALGQR